VIRITPPTPDPPAPPDPSIRAQEQRLKYRLLLRFDPQCDGVDRRLRRHGDRYVIGGVLMIWLSDRVAAFLQKNRMYEVLALFVLFVVGIMLVTEGGHLGRLAFFGHEIYPMTKATFYFVIAVLVLTDVVQGRYQHKLSRGAGGSHAA